MDPVSEQAAKRLKFIIAIALVLVLGFFWERLADKAIGAELPAQSSSLGCHMHDMPCPSWAAMMAEQFREGRIGRTNHRSVAWSPRVEKLLKASYLSSHRLTSARGLTDWLKDFEKHVTCGVATGSFVGDSACYHALSEITEHGDHLDTVLGNTNKTAVVCGGHVAIGFALKPWAGWWGVGIGGMDCLWGRYAEHVN